MLKISNTPKRVMPSCLLNLKSIKAFFGCKTLLRNLRVVLKEENFKVPHFSKLFPYINIVRN